MSNTTKTMEERIRFCARKYFGMEPDEVVYSDGDWLVRYCVPDDGNEEGEEIFHDKWGEDVDKISFVAIPARNGFLFKKD